MHKAFAAISDCLRAILAAAVFLLFLAPLPALAQSQIADPDALDTLFARLQNASSEMQAREIANDIWQIWMEPEDPVLNALMQDMLAARRSYNSEAALHFLDEIVTKWPEYAEGWNQRATIYYTLGRYEDSLADIDKVLEREPRHFGALAGQSLIYRTLGAETLALQSIIEALKYHPFLVERQLFPQLHEEPVTNI